MESNMKAIKIAFSLICLIIVICIFVIGALIFFVDPDKMKPALIEEVKNETGYDLTIDGKLSWSFYPRIGVKADHLQLKAGEQSRAFMDASGVSIAADLVELWQSRSRESLQGKITISSLSLMNVKFENVSADMKAVEDRLTLDSIQASLYGGTLQGTVSASHFATLPQWQWDMQIENIQLKPFLDDINGVDSKVKISGTCVFKMQAETSGKTREQLLTQLKGSNVFSVSNGIVEGIDLNYFLQLADATLHKQPVDQLVNSNQTAFNSLNGTAMIKNGMVETNDMMLVAPTFTTRAEGGVELISRKLDFKLKIKPQLQNTKIKWDIPVLISGDLDHPDVELDIMGIQKIIAGMQIDNIKQKAAAQIQKHVPGKTGEFLQHLLSK